MELVTGFVGDARREAKLCQFVLEKDGKVNYWNEVTSHGFRSVSHRPRCSFFGSVMGLEFRNRIAIVDFSESKLNDGDLESLKLVLGGIRKLWWIDLTNCGIDEESIREFSKELDGLKVYSSNGLFVSGIDDKN